MGLLITLSDSYETLDELFLGIDLPLEFLLLLGQLHNRQSGLSQGDENVFNLRHHLLVALLQLSILRTQSNRLFRLVLYFYIF